MRLSTIILESNIIHISVSFIHVNPKAQIDVEDWGEAILLYQLKIYIYVIGFEKKG